MKCISLLLASILFLTSTVVNAQTFDNSFCKKYPLNKKCRDNFKPNERTPERSSIGQDKTFDSINSQDAEKLLRELGYVDLSVAKDTILFLMQGRLTMVFIASNGFGISVTTFLPREESITLENLNDWNQDLRYSTASLSRTEKGELIAFQTYLTISGGVSERVIKTFFRHHNLYLTDFQKFLATSKP